MDQAYIGPAIAEGTDYMKVLYKTNIIERIDNAINEADENLVKIDEIQLNKLEWDMLRQELKKISLYEEVYARSMSASPGRRSIKFRGVVIAYYVKLS
jgi:hypothetical protein